ncbi:MAG: TRM11 family SAM-dependent methyltransferase, partial [Actinomycetes bacterium]
CCGIGTVLVEALSMGIQIEGRDINPFVCVGSRKNIAHFGFDGTVTLGAIAEVTEHYDVVILDMPYNVFTHISEENQQEIIKEARRIADKAVIVTMETMDEMIEQAGFQMVDRCIVKKGSFSRQVLVCV